MSAAAGQVSILLLTNLLLDLDSPVQKNSRFKLQIKIMILENHFEHVVKGFVEVVGDMFDLHLFAEQILLDLINPNVQPLDVHQSIFLAILGAFQGIPEVLDLKYKMNVKFSLNVLKILSNLVLIVFLSLESFLLGNFHSL